MSLMIFVASFDVDSLRYGSLLEVDMKLSIVVDSLDLSARRVFVV